MTTNTISRDYSSITSIQNLNHSFDTKLLFNQLHLELNLSPIDQFLENTTGLNLLWATKPINQDITKEEGILLLLGYVSAVESYFRAMIRNVVSIDPFSRRYCETYPLAYGAVLHHKSDLLPEALLEESVFSSKENITKGLTKFIGISLGNKFKDLLDVYEAICQLRHCCVHRFGRLGAKNAINLGLHDHQKLLEKPITLNKNNIIDLADILTTLVKSINNEVFDALLRRSVVETLPGNSFKGLGWKWHITRDRKLYSPYYKVFSTLRDSTPSLSQDELYIRFREVFKGV